MTYQLAVVDLKLRRFGSENMVDATIDGDLLNHGNTIVLSDITVNPSDKGFVQPLAKNGLENGGRGAGRQRGRGAGGKEGVSKLKPFKMF